MRAYLCVNKGNGDPIMVDYPGQLLTNCDNLTHHCPDCLMEENKVREGHENSQPASNSVTVDDLIGDHWHHHLWPYVTLSQCASTDVGRPDQRQEPLVGTHLVCSFQMMMFAMIIS